MSCIADALQMRMHADADAEQMQNAACRMQMQNALQMQIAVQNCRSENTLVISETACAPEALGRI